MVCAGFFVTCGNDDGVSGLLPDTGRTKSWIWLGNHAGLYRQNDLKNKRAFDKKSKARLLFYRFSSSSLSMTTSTGRSSG